MGEIVAVIPARYASTRFPGKPLALIDGRPMILHVIDRVAATTRVDRTIVATEDQRVVDVCTTAGVEAMMTADHHATGTDRLAEVAGRIDADIVVNVQGDEPIIDPAGIDAVVACLEAALPRGIDVSTGYLRGATPEQEASPSVVHLVTTLDGTVLTFSRLPVPAAFAATPERTVHLGLYAFTSAALARFASRQPGPVERAESVELLRFLEHGERIACTEVAGGSIAVDHPEDVARVEKVLAALRGGSETPR